MTHKIAHILGDLGDKAAAEIAKLETALGWPSEDVRLLALRHSQVRQKLKQLRLDPDDTRPKELYHALATRFSTDCQNLDKALKIGQATYSQKIHIAVELAKLCLKGQMLWTLKNSHIKQMLRAQPPVQTKKLLQFRSLESMLKCAGFEVEERYVYQFNSIFVCRAVTLKFTASSGEWTTPKDEKSLKFIR